jgi:hypothetical protein
MNDRNESRDDVRGSTNKVRNINHGYKIPSLTFLNCCLSSLVEWRKHVFEIMLASVIAHTLIRTIFLISVVPTDTRTLLQPTY